jgi:hypothetical protein
MLAGSGPAWWIHHDVRGLCPVLWHRGALPVCHACAKCSSMTDKAILASGERSHLGGVPVGLFLRWPSSERMPARRNDAGRQGPDDAMGGINTWLGSRSLCATRRCSTECRWKDSIAGPSRRPGEAEGRHCSPPTSARLEPVYLLRGVRQRSCAVVVVAGPRVFWLVDNGSSHRGGGLLLHHPAKSTVPKRLRQSRRNRDPPRRLRVPLQQGRQTVQVEVHHQRSRRPPGTTRPTPRNPDPKRRPTGGSLIPDELTNLTTDR